jgi:hypothetical protein
MAFYFSFHAYYFAGYYKKKLVPRGTKKDGSTCCLLIINLHCDVDRKKLKQETMMRSFFVFDVGRHRQQHIVSKFSSYHFSSNSKTSSIFLKFYFGPT